MKCFDCVHQRLCLNWLGGMDISLKEVDCKDFLELKYVPPVKAGDKVYLIQYNCITNKEEVIMGLVTLIDFHSSMNGISWWSITFTYMDEFFEHHYDTQRWGYHDFYRTKKEAEEKLNAST